MVADLGIAVFGVAMIFLPELIFAVLVIIGLFRCHKGPKALSRTKRERYRTVRRIRGHLGTPRHHFSNTSYFYFTYPPRGGGGRNIAQ